MTLRLTLTVFVTSRFELVLSAVNQADATDTRWLNGVMERLSFWLRAAYG